MVKGWGGFVGGFRFKSQWRQKNSCQKKKMFESYCFWITIANAVSYNKTYLLSHSNSYVAIAFIYKISMFSDGISGYMIYSIDY